jgi:hypothetical protein
MQEKNELTLICLETFLTFVSTHHCFGLELERDFRRLRKMSNFVTPTNMSSFV